MTEITILPIYQKNWIFSGFTEFVGPRTKRRATRGYRKGGISPKVHKRGFGEIKGFEFKKCFKASYGFYDAPRGRDFSYFGFIPTFGLILGWFYVVFMACFMSCLWHVLCRVYGMFCDLNWEDIMAGGKGMFRDGFGSKWLVLELPRSSLARYYVAGLDIV